MKKLLLIVFSVCSASVLNAQSIERFVIGATGNYTSTATLKVSATAGEAVIRIASTANLIVTEGFQQADKMATSGIKPNKNARINFKVYPNPASDVVTVEVSGVTTAIGICIYNAVGQRVKQLELWQVQKQGKIELDFSSFVAGNYLIEFNSSAGLLNRTITVQKIR